MPIKKISLLIKFVIAAILLLIFFPLAQQYSSSDFQCYYKGARGLLDGLNPYGKDFTFKLALIDRELTIRIWGTPLSIFPFLPFALFQYDIASKVFDLLLLIGCYGCFFYFVKTSSVKQTLFQLLFFPFGLVHCAIYWQSPSWIILSGLTLSIVAMRQNNYFLAGMFLCMFWLKPHLIAITALPALAFCFRQRNYQVIYGAIVGSLAMSLVLSLFHPTVFLDYLNSLADQAPLNFANMSIPSQINELFGFKYPIVLFLPGILISLFIAFRFHFKNLEQLIVLLLPISLSFAPYSWLHDYVLLMPFLALVINLDLRKYRNKLIFALMIVATLAEKYFGLNAAINYQQLFMVYSGIVAIVSFAMITEEANR